MKATVDSLLEPISADRPCGEDLGYDPQFLELDALLQGKEDTQFKAAEEPDWKKVEERCLDLFQRSKDLRVALRLALALLKLEGVPGFRDGLLVLRGLVEKYWDPVFPRLDPDDGNDPLERVNIFSSLATAAGTFGDPIQILTRLRQAPLTDSPQFGRISLMDIDRSNAVAADGAAGMTAGQVQAAFRSTPPEKLRAIYEGIAGAHGAVKEIDDLLTKAVGSSKSVAFDALIALLREQQKTVAPFAAPNENSEPGAEVAAGGAGMPAEGAGISGSVRTRQDVIRVLDQICDFYRRTEPSSPVPLILQRARRLVDMDFIALLTDLAPDSMKDIHLIAGIKPE